MTAYRLNNETKKGFSLINSRPLAFVGVLKRFGLKIFRRLGNSQQHINSAAKIKRINRIAHAIKPQIIAGRPQIVLGEPASIGGHIRAVNVTDC